MNKPLLRSFTTVKDITLIILAWLTISPLLMLPNKKGKYLKRRQAILLSVISPFTWTILFSLFLAFGISHFPSLMSKFNSFPEFSTIINSPDKWGQIILISYFLPVYTVCVLVLFLAMAITGWSYIEASVYICEYCEPVICILTAFILATYMMNRLWKMSTKGGLLILIPFGMEGILCLINMMILLWRIAEYQWMDINEIFDSVVIKLIDLGNSTHTNYIVANMIVYLLPMILILVVGFIGWAIYYANPLEDKTGKSLTLWLPKPISSFIEKMKNVLKTEFRQD